MIIVFHSTISIKTIRCIKQRCLIEEGDWIKLQPNGVDAVCMFCDSSIRDHIRKVEGEKKMNKIIKMKEILDLPEGPVC